ncbi:MAG: hypothetical protein HUU37_09845 [Bdellovibrionales bacterium]|nr:hypothetical protein [Bdellovibrionales bacterium]
MGWLVRYAVVLLCFFGFHACGGGPKRDLQVALDGSGVEPAVLALVSSWEVEWVREGEANPERREWREGEAIPFSVSAGDRLVFLGRDAAGQPLIRGEGTVPESGALRISLAPLPVP